MAGDEIVGASVKIDVGNLGGEVSGGGSETNKILKDILKELKRSTDNQVKQSKKAESGFGITSSIGGAISGAIGGTTGILAGLIGGAATLQGSENLAASSPVSYEKALIEGEERVIALNKQTGLIEEILSMQEAKDRGILNKKGEIDSAWDTYTKEQKKVLEGLAKQRDFYIITNEKLNSILSEEAKQLEWDKKITAAKAEIARKLERQAGIRSRDIVVETPSGMVSTQFAESFRTPGENLRAILNDIQANQAAEKMSVAYDEREIPFFDITSGRLLQE